MGDRINTGGTKEFSYSKEDMERIESTDTASSKAFKEAYAHHLAHKKQSKNILPFIIGGILILIALVIYVLL